MKLLYLTIGEAGAGVSKKLEDKADSLRKVGVDVHLIIVGSDRDFSSSAFTQVKVNQSLSQKIGSWFFLWRLSVVFEQWALYRAALQWVRFHPADMILFRYPVSDFFLWQFMLRCKQKIVFEHNTIEVFELNLRRRSSFYYQYFYWSERLFGKRVRDLSAGVIGVTPEITEYQSKLTNREIPSTTISNGINVGRVAQHKGPAFDGSHLNIVLLAGTQAQWHGVDILLNSLSVTKSDCLITCFIAGNISKEQADHSFRLSNVKVLPGQFGADLDRLIDQCHIGIGTLGFDSSFLTQACPLKVREYWARGIPFVIAYEDTDLIDNHNMVPFYLRLDVIDGCIDVDKIIEFAKKLYVMPNVSGQLRALADQQIDYQVKALQYFSFLESLQK